VLGVVGVDLVGQLAGGLAGLVALALAAQQLQDLVLSMFISGLLFIGPERLAAALAALAGQGPASASCRRYAD
jgi:hypothetical protein